MGLTAGSATAAPPSFVIPVSGPDDRTGFEWRVDTPALLLTTLPDGSQRVRLEGFARQETRFGAPDLPSHVLLIAIPPEGVPSLSFRILAEDRLAGLTPSSVARKNARLRPGVTDTGKFLGEDSVERTEVLEPDRAIYGGTQVWPDAVVRLGEIGIWRDQRYVQVIVSPVRFDPASHGLRVARSIDVKIGFGGGAVSSGAGAPDPRLDDLYRSMFVNAGQGASLRIVPKAPTAAAAPASTASPDGGPRYRIKIRANAPVRLDYNRLNGTGFETQALSTYKLTNRGVEVPILVFDQNGNDRLDSTDWIEFYGQALDDEPKAVLNTDLGNGAAIWEARDFTDENTYFLTAEAGTRSRLTTRSSPSDASAPATKFDAVAHFESDDTWAPLSQNDPWYWGPYQSNPTSGSAVAGRTLSNLALPGLSSGTDPAEVIVRLRGASEDSTIFPDHHDTVTFKNQSGQALAVSNDDGTWDGRTIYVHDFTWTYPGSGATLTDPAQIQIDLANLGGAYKNQVILDYAEIKYKRTFQASSDLLTFTWPDGDQEFQVSGLASNNAEVWELTGRVGTSDVVAPVRLTGASYGGAPGAFTARFHMTNDPTLPDGTSRKFLAVGDSGVTLLPSADFSSDTVSDLRNNANQADLIVIAHPTPLGPTSTTTLNNLLAWKSANLGMSSKVVMLQDVYDEFNDGLPGPQAIKQFLTWVMSTNPGEGWANPKPAWVLLIGDGSYDYKYNDTTVPPSNFVPTQILFKDDPSFGYYASDSLLADVVGTDTIPDLVMGRISTRTDAQTNTVLQKLLDYEQNPPSGNWRHHAVVISDRGKNCDPNEAADWENTNQAGIDEMTIPPYSQRSMKYWSDPQYCGGTCGGCTSSKADQLRSDIKSAVNGTDGISDGAAIVQFTGHGNFNVWSDDAFFAEGWSGIFDVNGLTNGSSGAKYPWLIVHNCLSAGFMYNQDVTLVEDWLKKSAGGSIAVFAPSGLTDVYYGMDVTQKIWGDLFGPTKQRMMGNAVADAVNFLCGLGVTQPCQNYVLLGDPTTRMELPTVAPPTSPHATGGNAVVNLSWTASKTTGANYNVWRAVSLPTGQYSKVNASPISGTTYGDTSAQNAKTYYYYIVAVDASGFESPWSNFNTDCGGANLDCLTATPLNPNPPAAPTGLVVTDPETGGKLNLSWNTNGENDIDHYTVNWGTSSGVYTSSVSAGKQTTYSLQGLTNQTTYYIAITATNTSGKTSANSLEGSGVPTFVRGIKSPEFISSLRIDKSGSNLSLSWAPVTTNIYGKPTTIANYEVYRGTTVTFVPGPGNKIGAPTAASFTDVGANSSAAPSYYYLVRAVDTSGNVGGLGNQLPNGIDTSTINKGTDGGGNLQLTLLWPAITTDFDGNPLVIDHYEVYATDHPYTRADIAGGSVPLLASPVASPLLVTPPSSSQYYSVIVVDARGNKSSF